jgi:hypothetical protein
MKLSNITDFVNLSISHVIVGFVIFAAAWHNIFFISMFPRLLRQAIICLASL